jgi:hypothetical protein
MNKTENLDKELKSIGEDLVSTLINGLSSIGKGDSELAASIQYKIQDHVIILDMDEYGIYLDSGTEPHMPPVDAIRPWAEARGLNAWGVAMNIKKYGTRAQPFLHSIDSIINGMGSKISDAGFKDLSIETDSIISKYFKNATIKD